LLEFQYRLYDLKLDYCAENAHGFWLDAGEDERVMAFMNRRAGEMQRKVDAESMWKLTLKEMHSFLRKK
jgi:Zn-finger nucleic acid-binding protein